MHFELERTHLAIRNLFFDDLSVLREQQCKMLKIQSSRDFSVAENAFHHDIQIA